MKYPRHSVFRNLPGYDPNGALLTDDKSKQIQRKTDKSDWLEELETIQEEARAARLSGMVVKLRLPRRAQINEQ